MRFVTSDSLTILDWGASHFAAANFHRTRKSTLRLDAWACEEVPSGVDSEAPVHAEATETAWRRIKRLMGDSRRVILCLPSPPVKLSSVAIAPLNKRDARRALDLEARQSLGKSVQAKSWTFCRTGVREGATEHALASLERGEVDRCVELLARIGFIVDAIVPQAFALASLLRFCPDDGDRANAFVQIGASTAHLLFSEKGRTSMQSLSTGGNAFTRTLADDLSLPVAEAEGLKRRLCSGASMRNVVGAFPGSKDAACEDDVVSEAFRRTRDLFAGRLQLEMTRAIVGHRGPAGSALPIDVHLLGGGSNVPGLCENLGQRSRLAVRSFDVNRIFTASDAIERMDAMTRLRMGDLAIVGQAFHFGNLGEASLLGRSMSRGAAVARHQPLLLGVAAITAVALAPPIVILRQSASTMSQRMTAVEDAVRARREIRVRISENAATIEKAGREIARWRKFAMARGNWVRFLAELQARLGAAGDMWLDRLQPFTATNSAHAAAGGLRLVMAGRVLTATPDESESSAEARVRSFLKDMAASPFIAAFEQERFNRSDEGILGFEVVFRMNRSESL